MSTKGWFALYTRSRFEKQVNRLLQEQGFETYLPLMVTTRKWSDRLKEVEVPLFNSYVFVVHDLKEPSSYLKILETPGVVRFISFEGKPVRVPDFQIEALKKLSKEGYDLESLEKPIPVGEEIEIKRGPLKGIRGNVVRSSDDASKMLVIRLDVLDKNILVKLPAGMVV